MLFYFNFNNGEITPLLSDDKGIYHYCAVLDRDTFEPKEIHCAFAKDNLRTLGYDWFETKREAEKHKWDNWNFLLPKLNSAILLYAPTDYVTVRLKPKPKYDYYEFWKCWSRKD